MHTASFGLACATVVSFIAATTTASVAKAEEAPRHESDATSRGAIEHRRLIVPNVLSVYYTGGVLGAQVGPIGFSSGKSETQSYRYVGIQPSADVVLGERWTVGGQLRLTHSTSEFTTPEQGIGYSAESLNLAASPRVGVLVPLGDNVTFWPQVDAVVGRTVRQTHSTGLAALGAAGTSGSPQSVKETTLGVGARASFIFPVTKYVYLNAGAGLHYLATRTDGVGAVDKALSFDTSGGLGLSF